MHHLNSKVGYVNGVRDQQYKVCSKEQFYEILDSPAIAFRINSYRQGNKEAKQELMAFVFQGMLCPEAVEQSIEKCPAATVSGSRKASNLVDNGLFLMDFDREEGDGRELYEKFISCMQANNIKVEGFLALAHVSASGHGLRLVLKRRQGTSIADDQQWIAGLMGEVVDEKCKDLSRLSFAVTRSDLIYINEGLLFDDVSLSTTTQPEVSQSEASQSVALQQATGQAETPQQEVSSSNLPFSKAPEGDLDAPLLYDGIPCSMIVEELEGQLGGVKGHGARNNFIYVMAQHLRYITDNDAEKIKTLLAGYYGEGEQKAEASIQSAVNTGDEPILSKQMKTAIDLARFKFQALGGASDLLSQARKRFPSDKRLPKSMAHILSRTPDCYKQMVSTNVFPALGAHLGGVPFTYIDNEKHEAVFEDLVIAPMSTGKSALKQPVDHILADISSLDDEHRAQDKAWKEECNRLGNSKDKPSRPKGLSIQILMPNSTDAAFTQRLADADGKMLYTRVDELEALQRITNTNKRDDMQTLMRNAFDITDYGQERVGTNSVCEKTKLRFCFNASSTPNTAFNYFRKTITNGTVSRLNLSTISELDYDTIPVFGDYDDDYDAGLKPYIDNLNLTREKIVSGELKEVRSPEAEAWINNFMRRAKSVISLSADKALETFSMRGFLITYHKAMILYIMEGMQWSKAIETYCEWAFWDDMYCKMYFFGDVLRKAQQIDNSIGTPGAPNKLAQLGDEFSKQNAINMRKANGMSEKPDDMLRNWVRRKYIVYDAARKMYMKTQLGKSKSKIA